MSIGPPFSAIASAAGDKPAVAASWAIVSPAACLAVLMSVFKKVPFVGGSHGTWHAQYPAGKGWTVVVGERRAYSYCS
jgi:hypothetical protein